ncbi:MAG: response regulator [Gemmatimonadota bacterium]|nr:response regulator [Gemmatimonadota bacterium]
MRVLLIDDEVENLNVLKNALKIMGHTSEQFIDPLEALEAFRKQKFDMVVTDIKMPLMSGLKVLRAVRKLDPQVRVLVITGFAEDRVAAEAMDEGSDAFFTKPLEIKEFLDTVSKIDEELKSGEKQ